MQTLEFCARSSRQTVRDAIALPSLQQVIVEGEHLPHGGHRFQQPSGADLVQPRSSSKSGARRAGQDQGALCGSLNQPHRKASRRLHRNGTRSDRPPRRQAVDQPADLAGIPCHENLASVATARARPTTAGRGRASLTIVRPSQLRKPLRLRISVGDHSFVGTSARQFSGSRPVLVTSPRRS